MTLIVIYNLLYNFYAQSLFIFISFFHEATNHSCTVKCNKVDEKYFDV